MQNTREKLGKIKKALTLKEINGHFPLHSYAIITANESAANSSERFKHVKSGINLG